MIIYMLDMTTRRSPVYIAGDCLFLGYRTKERSRSRGSQLLQAGRPEMFCGGGFLIACLLLVLSRRG